MTNTILIAQTNASKGEFTLNGRVIGQDTGYIHLVYLKGEKNFHDSCILKNGKFFFKGTIKEPNIAYLFGNRKSTAVDDPNSTDIFLEPTTINAVFQVNNFKHGKVTGSISHDEYAIFNLEEDKVRARWKSEFNMTSYRADIDSVRYKFIIHHPNSYVSAYVLQMLRVTTDSLKMCIAAMNLRIRRSSMVVKMQNKIKNVEKGAIAIGKIAPNFNAFGVRGNRISLKDFRGKIVLLNFWASWCLPCREENLVLVKLFNHYKSKKFIVLGFSLDNSETEKAWKMAIKKDGLEWPQLSDLKGRESVVAQQYNIREIPCNFLIDKNGAIISVNLSVENIEKKLEELLGY